LFAGVCQVRVITADFEGAAFSPGTKVSFESQKNTILNGVIQKLFIRHARVITAQEKWDVAYKFLTIREKTTPPAMPLHETEALGKQLIKKHQSESALDADWQFGFDLAPARGGICRYTEKLITLSVTFCLKASRQEITDTILHEIAHAIAGHRHGHNRTWKAIAQRIGCTGERCHEIKHTVPGWRGQCDCSNQWTRQRLSRQARWFVCRSCKGQIRWRQETVT